MEGELVDFLLLCIQQILSLRRVYSPLLFERRRAYGSAPVSVLRHADALQYLHDHCVTDLRLLLDTMRALTLEVAIFESASASSSTEFQKTEAFMFQVSA